MIWRCGKRVAWRSASLLTALAWAVLAVSPTGPLTIAWVRHPAYDEQLAAAQLMAECQKVIARHRTVLGLPLDRSLDPNVTGLIGEEFTPLTTSLGELELKRTSANPAFAAVMVHYFRAAGLRRGEVVAVGASGSFPALLIATLCAAKVCELQPVVIASVGASMYGANLPGFAITDMLTLLEQEKCLPESLAAVSLGGEGDRGEGVLLGEGAEALLAAARRSGVPLIREPSLARSIRQRLNVYTVRAGARPVRCFVNVGGADPNYGGTEASLRFPRGLVTRRPPVTGPGLIFTFAERGVPVINLLDVGGLARENGLPFDPVPFPAPGAGEIYTSPLTLRLVATVFALLALAIGALKEVVERRAGAPPPARERAAAGWRGNLE